MPLTDIAVLDLFVRDDKNIIEKYGNIKIKTQTEEIDFNVYIQEKPRDSFAEYKLIFIAELDNDTLYSIEISSNEKYKQNILDKPEEYLKINYKKSNIAMLD